MNARPRAMLLGTLFLLAVSGTVGSAPLVPCEVQQTTLDNGLRVVLIPTPSDGLVTYWTRVKSGSGVESESSRTGFAHFFEHLIFSR